MFSANVSSFEIIKWTRSDFFPFVYKRVLFSLWNLTFVVKYYFPSLLGFSLLSLFVINCLANKISKVILEIHKQKIRKDTHIDEGQHLVFVKNNQMAVLFNGFS